MTPRWLISYARTVGAGAGAHQVFCNQVLEEDPIMWLIKQVLAHQPTVLISIGLFKKIRDTINP